MLNNRNPADIQKLIREVQDFIEKELKSYFTEKDEIKFLEEYLKYRIGVYGFFRIGIGKIKDALRGRPKEKEVFI